MALPAAPPDQAVAIEDGVNGALGGHADVSGQPPHEELADFAGAPVRLFPLEPHNQALDRLRQLVGVADRAPGAVAKASSPCSLYRSKIL
jgi:hypothetical protein